MQFFTTLAVLVAAARAISVNTPAQNAVWTTGQDQTVSWTSVNTDATNVSVYLVNYSRYPTTSVLIQSGVATSAGGVTVPGSDITATGAGYQVNLLAVTNPSQILAQSNQFSIVAGSSSSSSSSSASASSSSSATATAAAGVTTSTSSSSSAAVSSGASSASNGTLPTSSTSDATGLAKASTAGLFLAALICLV